MGLDQYLYRRSYVHSGDYYNSEQKEEIQMTRGGKEVDTSKIKFIVEEVGYWRKANAIHKWLVENVQKGNDDCKEYVVFPNQLQKLKGLCLEIIEDGNKAPELLPTTNGFFFGGTEYDEYYFDDLHETVKIIDEALSDPDGDYYYSSSW